MPAFNTLGHIALKVRDLQKSIDFYTGLLGLAKFSRMPDDGGELMSGWYNSKAVWSSGNIADPDYDKIFQDQLAATDSKSRAELLQRFAKLEDERKRSIPLFWCGESFAVGPRVKDLKPAVGSPYHLKLESVELVKK